MAFDISPGNDFECIATLWTVNASTGVKTPLSSGTVSAFIATTNGPTATYADAALNTTATYTGTPGKWLVAFSGTTSLTYAVLNPLFGSSGTPYLIVQQTTPAAIRIYETLTYVASRAAIEN